MFIDGTDPPQTAAANVAGHFANIEFKALVEVLFKAGYVHPALEAAALGLMRIIPAIDVCTAASQWVTMRN